MSKHHVNTEFVQLKKLPNRILALDAGGVPHSWIDHEKAAYYITKGLVMYEPSNVQYTMKGGTSRMTCEQSTLNLKTMIAIKGATGSLEGKKRLPYPKADTLFRRDHYVCCYCGQKYRKPQLQMEHVLPVSKGGKNTWLNMVTACEGCNSYKMDRTPQEADMKMYYQPYVPNFAEFLILSNVALTEDQQIYLQQFIKNDNSRWHTNFVLEERKDKS